MTLAEAARTDDGVVTPRSDRPQRRGFTAECKADILADYDAADRGGRGAVLRRESLYSSHIVRSCAMSAGSTVHREVSRLVENEVLRERREGRNRLVRANQDHALFGPMRELVAATYGPVPVMRELFDGVGGVERLLIHGSWAARRAGQSGGFPNDIDVLVVGSVARRTLAEIATEASARLDLPVNATRMGAGEWEADEPSPFVATIRARPIVDVLTGELHG